VPWTQLLPGRITPDIVEADGRALRTLTQMPGILYNKVKFPEFKNVKLMADLLKPEFKGRFVTTPYLAGYDVLLSNDKWGYDKTAEYVTQLASQVSGLVPCGATERIASGEIPALALDCSGSEQNRPRFKDVLDLQVVPDKDKKVDRAPSVATSKDFKYEDVERRLTYTGDAHMNGPEGDMKAAKIELYLKPSGDELERAEAYDALTLREQERTTTGSRLTYTTADEKYVVTGAPVTIVDQCERETTGKTLTFIKATDSIVIDGNQQIRTQTKGGGKCS
jgi:lipopolysaccharide export system protein LptA